MGDTLDRSALVELSREECFDLLRAHSVGRLAVAVPGGAPLVVPVNYRLDGEAIVFRSAAGTKLRSLRGTPVSFQLDQIDPSRRTGWSVLVRGSAYETTRWETDHVDVRPWAGDDKTHWVRIVADVITGRRIQPTDDEIDLGGYL